MVTDQELYAMRPVAARIDPVAEYCWQTSVTRIDDTGVTHEQTLPTRYYFSGAVADVVRCELYHGWMSPLLLLLCFFRACSFEVKSPYIERVSAGCNEATAE